MHKFEIDGKQYEIPKFADLPLGALRKARKADNELDATFELLEHITKDRPEILEAIDTMSVEQFGAWFEAWAGGASLGE